MVCLSFLLVSHRTSWGILPQTPVFSLRSSRCHWQSLIMARQPKDSFKPPRLASLGPSSAFFPGGPVPQTPRDSLGPSSVFPEGPAPRHPVARFARALVCISFLGREGGGGGWRPDRPWLASLGPSYAMARPANST
jgi:hypothetical protein